jgi:hypothetical protein
MRSLLWWCSVGLALCLVASYHARVSGGRLQPPAESVADRSSVDAIVYSTLRDVINRGAELYNSGDIAGCYRLFEGSLRTVKPLLAHHPELQKTIDSALVSAERDAYTWRRAFTLRGALDKVRAEIKPKQVGEKKEPEKKAKEPVEKKEPEKKEPEKKEPEKKETSEKDPPELLEKKPAEDKDSPEKKSPDDKKEPPSAAGRPGDKDD